MRSLFLVLLLFVPSVSFAADQFEYRTWSAECKAKGWVESWLGDPVDLGVKDYYGGTNILSGEFSALDDRADDTRTGTGGAQTFEVLAHSVCVTTSSTYFAVGSQGYMSGSTTVTDNNWISRIYTEPYARCSMRIDNTTGDEAEWTGRIQIFNAVYLEDGDLEDGYYAQVTLGPNSVTAKMEDGVWTFSGTCYVWENGELEEVDCSEWEDEDEVDELNVDIVVGGICGSLNSVFMRSRQESTNIQLSEGGISDVAGQGSDDHEVEIRAYGYIYDDN